MRGVARIESLGRDECLACLASTATGRIAATQMALPVVFPIRFSMVAGSVVFSLPPGSPMWAATEDHVVAFEADSGTDNSDCCWTVQVQGVCREVTSPVTADSLKDLPLPRWHTSGALDHLMVLRIERISGERIIWGLAEPSEPDEAPPVALRRT
ncbi:MAG TPA: pyridoxamine 5'-phosphate oxidase family protein [Acidimicrobiales bacterium]|nr:pyridoxamine 5'-phosphate oxidase family protein [Acidimicrobiales bacterium]